MATRSSLLCALCTISFGCATYVEPQGPDIAWIEETRFDPFSRWRSTDLSVIDGETVSWSLLRQRFAILPGQREIMIDSKWAGLRGEDTILLRLLAQKEHTYLVYCYRYQQLRSYFLPTVEYVKRRVGIWIEDAETGAVVSDWGRGKDLDVHADSGNIRPRYGEPSDPGTMDVTMTDP